MPRGDWRFVLHACLLYAAASYGQESEEEEGDDSLETKGMEDADDFDADLKHVDWYYVGAGQAQQGPIKFDHVKHLFFKGNITMYTQVWTPEFKDWKQLRIIPGIRNGLSEGRGYKERLQLFAIDEKRFVQELRKAEKNIPDVGADGNEMFCARAGAVGEVLRREVVKRLLKDVLRDLREGEAEKTKLLKSIKATRYSIARTERISNTTLFTKRREAILLQKKATLYWNKMVELQRQQQNASVVQHWGDLVQEVGELIIDEQTRYMTLACIGVPLFAILGCLMVPTRKPPVGAAAARAAPPATASASAGPAAKEAKTAGSPKKDAKANKKE